MTANQIKALLQSKVKEAKQELDDYQPASVDWYQRCFESVDTLFPWLRRVAPGLRREIDALLESPQRVRAAWERIKREADIPEQLQAEMDQCLERLARFLCTCHDVVFWQGSPTHGLFNGSS